MILVIVVYSIVAIVLVFNPAMYGGRKLKNPHLVKTKRVLKISIEMRDGSTPQTIGFYEASAASLAVVTEVKKRRQILPLWLKRFFRYPEWLTTGTLGFLPLFPHLDRTISGPFTFKCYMEEVMVERPEVVDETRAT